MKHLLLCTPLVFALAACVKPLEVDTAPVGFVASKSFDKTRIVSTGKATVRVFVKNAEDKPVEVRGAKCTLKSPELQATVITPAAIIVPLIKGKPQPLTVTCSGNGMTNARLAPATLVGPNSAATVQTNSAAGLVATLIVAGIAQGYAQSRDHWVHFPEGSIFGVGLQQ